MEETPARCHLCHIDLARVRQAKLVVDARKPLVLKPGHGGDTVAVVKAMIERPQAHSRAGYNVANTDWRCEVLFLRGINPYRRIAEVSDLSRLIDLSHRLLLANRERAGQATTGSLRHGASSYVYARKGLPCRRCRTPIQRGLQGDPGYERDTYWCPHCQPA